MTNNVAATPGPDPVSSSPLVAEGSRESRWRMCRLGLFVTITFAATLIPTPVQAAIRVTFCSGQPGCICIDWDRGSSSWLEVRCPSGGGDSGWTDDPSGSPIDDPGGGWRGPGGGQDSDQPGNILSPELSFAWNNAKESAWSKLRGDKNCCIAGKIYFTPNECTNLFQGNPMGWTGADLVRNYIVPRRGEGVQGPDGTTPCDSASIALWTTCCSHDPDVLVCDRFVNSSFDEQVALIIHEALHVAGQPEDQTTTAGPGDDPTSSDIQATVREACGL